MVLTYIWEEELTQETMSNAKCRLGETLERKTKSLEELRQLIKGETGFSPVMDDINLLRFLRVRKYNVKKAFKTLKNFYYYKHRYSGIVTDFTPSQLKKVFAMNKTFFSPKRDLTGAAIAIMTVGTLDVKEVSPYDFLAAAFLCAEIDSEREATQINGVSIILDFRGTSLAHLSNFASPSYLAAVVRGAQDCWPHRINAFHLIEPPSFFGIVYNIARPMLSLKMRDRIHFHSDGLESLHIYIPPESLPKELGGRLEEHVFSDFLSFILSKESYMHKLNKYIYKGKPSLAMNS